MARISHTEPSASGASAMNDEFEDRKATAAEVRAHADALQAHAATVGVTNLRLHENGTLVVHCDQPGYTQVLRLSHLAEEAVGCYVHIITDDVPGARGAVPL